MDNLYRFKIDKKCLSKIDKEERAFFFSLGHVANEINLLSKSVVWCGDFSSETDHLVKGQLTLTLFFYRTLAGKLNEANELFKKSFLSKKFSKAYVDSFDEKTKETLAEIKKYFGKINKVNTIRNSQAFHYWSDDFAGDLSEIPDNLDIFLHKTQGNSLYYASELMVTYAMAKSCGHTDLSRLFDEIVSELNSVSKLILSFAHQFMNEFMKQHSVELVKDKPDVLDIGKLQPFTEVNIPWFVDLRKTYP